MITKVRPGAQSRRLLTNEPAPGYAWTTPMPSECSRSSLCGRNRHIIPDQVPEFVRRLEKAGAKRIGDAERG
jgi:hypothetical protein